MSETNEASVQSVVMPMSLEQAWLHVKALWPNAVGLSRHDGKPIACYMDSTLVIGPMFFYRIEPGIVDWPEGVTKYPPHEGEIT